LNLEKDWPLIPVVFLIMIAVATLYGCDDDKKPIIHWKVYRENAPKDFTLWTMPNEPKLKEGFVCWEQDGNNICVSGKLTIQSYIAGEK